jgi:hypothetical protein
MWHFLPPRYPRPAWLLQSGTSFLATIIHCQNGFRTMISSDQIALTPLWEAQPSTPLISPSTRASAKHSQSHKKLYGNMDFNMELDDSDHQDGGVSLIAETSTTSAPSSPSSAISRGFHPHFSTSSTSSQSNPRGPDLTSTTKSWSPPSPKPYAKGVGFSVDTDLSPTTPPQAIKPIIRLTISVESSPTTHQSTPKTYARSPLTTIPEEHTKPEIVDLSLDDDDDEGMLDPEETSTGLDHPSSVPASLPEFSKPFQTQYGSPSPSPLKKKSEDKPTIPHRRSSIPEPKRSKLCHEIDSAYSDDESAKKGDEKGVEKRVEYGEVKIEWDNSLWPPENMYERELCERVCEEVAVANGFQKVVIR